MVRDWQGSGKGVVREWERCAKGVARELLRKTEDFRRVGAARFFWSTRKSTLRVSLSMESQMPGIPNGNEGCVM